MTVAGLTYIAFLLLSFAGSTLRNVPVQLIANAVGFALAVLLYRLFAAAETLMALALLPLAFVHYLIQGIGQVRSDTGMLRLALVPFAAYLILLGYLITRSAFAPDELGIGIVLAGVAWLIAVAPGVPTWSTLAVVVFGVVVEVTLAIWLLTAPWR